MSVLAFVRKGRQWVRAVGAAHAIAALEGALRDGEGTLAHTRWPAGVQSTHGHSATRPARGVRIVHTLAEHHAWLARYADAVHAKGTGIVLGYATSRTGGSSNDEIESITALLGDADGAGDWGDAVALLRQAGMAAVLQSSGGHTPERPKWHLIAPLARPLVPRDGESTRGWSTRVRGEYGFALGVLSELAGLDERQSTPPHSADAGFDAAIANRLCQPSYPGCRRTPSAPAPETLLVEGRYLDLGALLATANFVARAARVSNGDTLAPAGWLAALRAAGLLGDEIAPGKFVALCPNRAAHTAGHDSDGTSSTVAFADGRFKCLRGACEHVTGAWVSEYLRVNVPAAAAVLTRERESAGVRRLREMLAEGAERTSLEAIGARVREAIDEHAPGTLTIAAPTAGTGKSHTAVEAALSRADGAILSHPTHALAAEWRDKAEAIEPDSTRLHRSVLRAIDHVTQAPVCVHYERASAWQAAGGSVPRAFCSRCEVFGVCRARYPEGHGRVDITVHALELDTDKPLIFDETPALFEEVAITRPDLDRAQDLLGPVEGAHVLTNDYQRRITPWLRVVDAAWDDREHDLAAAAERFVRDDCGDGRAGARVIADAFEPRAWDEGKRRWIKPEGVPHEQPTGDPLREVVRLAELAGEVALRDADEISRAHGARWRADLDALRIFRALGAAAARPRWRRVDGQTVLAGQILTDAAVAIRDRGAIVLDATPPLEALRALNPAGVTLTLDAADGAMVTRTVYYASDAYRRKLAPRRWPDWDRIVPLVTRALGDAKVTGARRLLFVSYKPIVTNLDESDAMRELVDAWRAEGGVFDTAHYGAVRGLNRWQSFDGCLTVGDPWANKPSAVDEADALGLRDFAPAYVAAARGELAQAHGRLRDVRRDAPAWHGHIGQLAPAGWGSSTRVVTSSATPEGGRRGGDTSAVTRERLRVVVEALGGVRPAARELGVAGGTVGDWLAGRRGIPAGVVSRCVALTGESVRETPIGDAPFAKPLPRDLRSPLYRGFANTTHPCVTPELSATVALGDDGVLEVALTPPVERIDAPAALAAMGLLLPGRRVRLRDATGAYEVAA